MLLQLPSSRKFRPPTRSGWHFYHKIKSSIIPLESILVPGGRVTVHFPSQGPKAGRTMPQAPGSWEQLEEPGKEGPTVSVCVGGGGARWPPELEGRAQSFQNLDPPQNPGPHPGSAGFLCADKPWVWVRVAGWTWNGPLWPLQHQPRESLGQQGDQKSQP